MELKIGTILILETTYTEQIERLRCKVVEQKENAIYIDYPTNVVTKKTVFLLDGAQFRATFNTDSKESFVFQTEVIGRRGGNVPMIMLSCPPTEEFIKIQRRQYVRVETPVDVAVGYDDTFYQFAAEDISAGGLALHLKQGVTFQEGNTVKLTIVLPFSNGEIYYIQTLGDVVRIFERDHTTIASIQFSDTDDIDKQHIVRFCFERQLMIRKKEMQVGLEKV